MRLILEIAAGVALGIFAFVYILKMVAHFRQWLGHRRAIKAEERLLQSRYEMAVSQGAPAEFIGGLFDLETWERAYRDGETERWIGNKQEEPDYWREESMPDTPETRTILRAYRRAIRPWRPR
jgi:hypothetical protein